MPEQTAPGCQQPAAALPDRVWDAAVVGAGPAGAAAAAHLAAGGYHVLLLDREAFPREKVCGDGLLPDALAALERLGLREVVARVGRTWGGVSVWSPGQIPVDVPGEYLTLRRSALDHLLADSAVGRGATFARGEAVGLAGEGGPLVRLRVAGAPREVRARYAVLATGARRGTLRRLGLPVPPSPPDGVAVRGYARSTAGPERLVVSYDRSVLPGYGWIFPLGEGLYNLGCGGFRRRRPADLRACFERFMASFPPARDLLAAGDLLGVPRAGPLRCALGVGAPAAWGRVVLAGEALGTTLPFTGEGVGKALETGERAARWVGEALRVGAPAVLGGYAQDLQRELAPRYWGYRAAENWLSAAWVCDLVARRARRSAHLREAASRVLREEAPPWALFSVAGLARSLFR